MKQLLIFSVLMLANIVLLAHVVLPHSHHDGIVCFSLEEMLHGDHCSDCQTENTDNCCCNHHNDKHHHHGNSDDCDLKNIVLRQNSDLHDEILPCANCLSLLYTIYPLNELFLEVSEFGQRLQLKPYLETHISPFVGSIKGLRAPPTSYFLG